MTHLLSDGNFAELGSNSNPETRPQHVRQFPSELQPLPIYSNSDKKNCSDETLQQNDIMGKMPHPSHRFQS